jgi:alpha-aminoadipic semialdehyde synthase
VEYILRVIGIRREDKSDWERRAPLTPEHVRRLAGDGIDIHVQRSAKRAFADDDYAGAGARLGDDLDGCRVVMGVKEIPPDELRSDTTYLFFSHTTKGQPHNMPMLRRLIELGATLIDYENVVDDRGLRLIFFGRHAGYAGMIDGLWALGRRLELEGHTTPFAELRPAHAYADLDEARAAIAAAGERIRDRGLPETLHPLVFGITGTGNVSSGEREILDGLPVVS